MSKISKVVFLIALLCGGISSYGMENVLTEQHEPAKIRDILLESAHIKNATFPDAQFPNVNVTHNKTETINVKQGPHSIPTAVQEGIFTGILKSVASPIAAPGEVLAAIIGKKLLKLLGSEEAAQEDIALMQAKWELGETLKVLLSKNLSRVQQLYLDEQGNLEEAYQKMLLETNTTLFYKKLLNVPLTKLVECTLSLKGFDRSFEHIENLRAYAKDYSDNALFNAQADAEKALIKKTLEEIVFNAQKESSNGNVKLAFVTGVGLATTLCGVLFKAGSFGAPAA